MLVKVRICILLSPHLADDDETSRNVFAEEDTYCLLSLFGTPPMFGRLLPLGSVRVKRLWRLWHLGSVLSSDMWQSLLHLGSVGAPPIFGRLWLLWSVLSSDMWRSLLYLGGIGALPIFGRLWLLGSVLSNLFGDISVFVPRRVKLRRRDIILKSAIRIVTALSQNDEKSKLTHSLELNVTSKINVKYK